MWIDKKDKAWKIKCLSQIKRKTLNEFRVISQTKREQETDLLQTKFSWAIGGHIFLNVTKNRFISSVNEYVMNWF